MTPTQAMFNNMAREPVELENVSGTLYVFGSELATLRIFAKYNANGAHPNSKARVGHSVNLGKFYFALENVTPQEEIFRQLQTAAADTDENTGHIELDGIDHGGPFDLD